MGKRERKRLAGRILIKSRYPGKCDVGGEVFEKGEMIYWNPEDGKAACEAHWEDKIVKDQGSLEYE